MSGLQSSIDDVSPVLGIVRNAFLPFGVDLQFTRGRVLARDPVKDGGWHDLVQALIAESRRFQPPGPGHLVATYFPPDDHVTINGMLMDQMRGVSAIFLGAAIYEGRDAGTRPDLVAQICIHEIGHMFDLTHGDAQRDPSNRYVSAMNQATDRARGLPAEAWTAAVRDAAQRGEPALTPSDPSYAYPFNAVCRACLRTAASQPTWMPFRTAFRGGFHDGVDDAYRRLDMRIGFHADLAACQREGALFATLVLRNTSDAAVDLPLHIGLDDGSLRLSIVDPAGDRHDYIPGQWRCSDARQLLPPGGELVVPLTAASRSSAPLFTRVGPHGVECRLVDERGGRTSIIADVAAQIDVIDTPAGRAAARAMRRAPGQSRPRPPLIDDDDGDPIAASLHSRVLLASTKALVDRRRRTERFIGLFDERRPLAVRHSAARDFALDRINRGISWEQVADQLVPDFSGSDHAGLFDQIKRSGEGFARLMARAPKEVR